MAGKPRSPIFGSCLSRNRVQAGSTGGISAGASCIVLFGSVTPERKTVRIMVPVDVRRVDHLIVKPQPQAPLRPSKTGQSVARNLRWFVIQVLRDELGRNTVPQRIAENFRLAAPAVQEHRYHDVILASTEDGLLSSSATSEVTRYNRFGSPLDPGNEFRGGLLN